VDTGTEHPSKPGTISIPGLIAALLLPNVIGVTVVSALGAIGKSAGSWYPSLRKPTWSPPGWLFGPAWTVLYLMMGFASWRIWRNRDDQPELTRSALHWYGIQLGLNASWSVIFFGARLPALALLEILALWGAILATLVEFSRIDRLAAMLLVPYQLWVTFATALNAAIWWLNRDASSE
jgi:benzodiazapine receptor